MYQHLMCGGRQAAARSTALVGGRIPVPESWGDAESFKVMVKASFIWGFKRGASDKLTATCQFNAFPPPSSTFARLCLPRR